MRRYARRAVLLGASVGALAAPIAALAAGHTYKGTTDGNGTVSFKTVVKKGKITGLSHFTWSVTTHCNIGDATENDSQSFPIKVRHNKIVTSSEGLPYPKITGRFSNGGEQAHGTFRDKTSFQGTTCDTGTLNWTVTRG